MAETSLQKETEAAVRLVREAVRATERIRQSGIQGTQKPDHTPITQADLVAQAILLRGLQEHFPEDRVLAEEFLLPGRDTGLRTAASGVLHELGVPGGERDLEQYVNYRGNPSGVRQWMVDPIDGTRGFERDRCYAVVMGLFAAGRPVFGCMAAPLLPLDGGVNTLPVIVYGGPNTGAFWLDAGEHQARPIRVSAVETVSRLRLVASRAHDGIAICQEFMARTGADQLIQLDGQAKYLLLASGRADLYLRRSNPSYGIAYPWDHCAGQAILEGAGGRVSDFDDRPLNYEQPRGRPIMDSNGLAASNGRCHEQVLQVVRAAST
jgi:3'(2'), 5'-bisphosphate nucleotidase